MRSSEGGIRAAEGLSAVATREPVRYALPTVIGPLAGDVGQCTQSEAINHGVTFRADVQQKRALATHEPMFLRHSAPSDRRTGHHPWAGPRWPCRPGSVTKVRR
mgnify:CR=1 FL=1